MDAAEREVSVMLMDRNDDIAEGGQDEVKDDNVSQGENQEG
jgi:hypothetical protein